MKAQGRYYGERMTTCIGKREEIQEDGGKKSVDVKKATEIAIEVMRDCGDGLRV